MDGRPISSRRGKHCSRAWLYDHTFCRNGLDDGWLCMWSVVNRILGLVHDSRSARNPTLNLCFTMASRWVRHPSLTLWNMLTIVKVEFRVSAYLGGAGGVFREMVGRRVDDDNDRFERTREGGVVGHFGHLRGRTAVCPQRCRREESKLLRAIRARERSTPMRCWRM
ncbi:hypothetical protein ARMSODRAFT_289197 [Armillaria solidipes]|uniref:Uncharacterized protein n=1 Tax=Armillaria solidipes TaxID=1076256 RepID=A0A2H3C3C2_9AGAR|nr:hypothetical protein ARMSODRAFT_289197 [Armillaria solidipes]